MECMAKLAKAHEEATYKYHMSDINVESYYRMADVNVESNYRMADVNVESYHQYHMDTSIRQRWGIEVGGSVGLG